MPTERFEPSRVVIGDLDITEHVTAVELDPVFVGVDGNADWQVLTSFDGSTEWCRMPRDVNGDVHILSAPDPLPVTVTAEPPSVLEPLTVDDLRAAFERMAGWSGRDRADMAEAVAGRWDFVANPADVGSVGVTPVPGGGVSLGPFTGVPCRLSEAVPPGQILAFNRALSAVEIRHPGTPSLFEHVDNARRPSPDGGDDRHPRARRGEVPVSVSLLGTARFPRFGDGTYRLDGEAGRFEVVAHSGSGQVAWMRRVEGELSGDPLPDVDDRRTPDETLDRIDETLTFYSAGLGAELEVPYNSHPEYRIGHFDDCDCDGCEPAEPEPPEPAVDWQPRSYGTFTATVMFLRVSDAMTGALLAQGRKVAYVVRALRRRRRNDPARLRLRRMRHRYRLRRRGRW